MCACIAVTQKRSISWIVLCAAHSSRHSTYIWMCMLFGWKWYAFSLWLLKLPMYKIWFMGVMNVCATYAIKSFRLNHIKLNGLCIFCHKRLFNMVLVWLCVWCEHTMNYVTKDFCTAITLKIDIKLPSFFLGFCSIVHSFAVQMMKFFISKCVIHFVIPCMSFELLHHTFECTWSDQILHWNCVIHMHTPDTQIIISNELLPFSWILFSLRMPISACYQNIEWKKWENKTFDEIW